MKKKLFILTSFLLAGAITACSATNEFSSGADGGYDAPSGGAHYGAAADGTAVGTAAGEKSTAAPEEGKAVTTAPGFVPEGDIYDAALDMEAAADMAEGIPYEEEYGYNGIPEAAGTLTAGEWTDNDHYSFWRDLFQYGDTGWEEYRTLWNRDFCSRIFVTVAQNGKPVENSTITLYNADGDLLWTAKTDNEGRAYLFYLASELAKGELTVKSDFNGEMTVTGEDQAVAFIIDGEEKKTAPSLDLALVVDTTGSMGDELSYFQKELEDVISRAAKDNGNIPVRLSVDFYRDDGDEYVVRDFDFTDNIASAIADLNAQMSDGGGDYPEKVNAALDTAINNLSWNEDSTKLLFIILDAPPHIEAAEDMNILTRQAAEKGIRVIPILASGGDKETEFLMRDFALKTGGTYLFLTDDSGVSVGGHITPTTGAYTVEKLNDLMVRVINRYLAQKGTVAEYVDINVEFPEENGTDTSDNNVPPAVSGDITMTLFRNNGNNIEFLIENNTDREYSMARYFSVEKLEGGKWINIEPDDMIMFTDDMIIIPSGESYIFTAPVYGFWKNLEAGIYRVVIESVYAEDSFALELYGEFEVEDTAAEGDISMLLRDDPKRLGENDPLEYIVRNRTEYEYSYGLGFSLEKLVNEEWEEVPPTEEFAVIAIAVIVPPGENSLFTAPVYTYWKGIEDGVYRVVLNVSCEIGNDTLYGQFSVVDGRIESGLFEGSPALDND